MSSLLRRVAQDPAHAPVRTKFFLVHTAITSQTPSGTAPVAGITLSTSQTALTPDSIVLSTNVTTIFANGASVAAGRILRDLGRKVTIVDAAGRHLAVYRNVQLVSGATTGGVGGTSGTTAPDPYLSNLYVLVWSYNGANVNVARTG